LGSDIIAIAAGYEHTCALTNAGGVQCWGSNSSGELGNGSIATAYTPVDVNGLSISVTAVAAGYEYTCALTNAGGVKCWGSNRYGQLGNGEAWKETPQDVIGFSAPPPPPPTGDAFENDDTCGKATFLSANIDTQAHTFHQAGDADWIRIEVVTGTHYTLVANALTGGAIPGFELRNSCVTPPVATSPPSFGGEVRLPMPAGDYPPGTYYIKIANTPASTFGNEVGYTLNLRAVSYTGAAILVAGKNGGAIHQNVITNTTDLAYRTLLRNGFSKDDILYLSSEPARDVDGNGLADDIDAPANVANVQNAITQWARTRVGPARPLWLYLADHGFAEQFLVSGNGIADVISPAQLDGWLSELESATGVDQVNVIIDACNAGSFITQPGSISRGRRVVLASTSAERVAMGRPAETGLPQRMYFSEAVWSALDANLTLQQAFEQGRAAAWLATNQYQQAWLDDNGDGNPDSAVDGANAAFRGLVGSVGTGGRPVVSWQVTNVTNGLLVVSARAGAGVSSVRVEVLRPDRTQTLVNGELNVLEADRVTLTDTGNGIWVGNYGQFDAGGEYALVVYAWDSDGSPAQPAETRVQVVGSPTTPTPVIPTPATPTPVTPTPESHRVFAPVVQR
jgi:hypothetical protein